jgi:long-chain acyl-CoA synthetase
MKINELKQLLAVISVACLPLAAVAAEVEGVQVPDRVRLSDPGPELVLNGAGVRTRFFFRVYVGALYLAQKSTVARAVIDDPGAKRMALHMLRELSAEQFVGALEDGLKNNHSAAELAGLEPQVQQLRTIFDAVKTAKPGDVIYIDYLPDAGTRITVNGAVQGVIAGGDFNRALLRIWLGDDPADSDLKKGLLGG